MKYERQKVEVSSLQEGDHFELPRQPDTICRVNFHRLKEDDDGQRLGVIGYDILDGPLRWPWIYLLHDYPITLLLPITTFVALGGKDWIKSVMESADE